MRTRKWPMAAVLCGLAVLVLVTLRDVLVARGAVVPGRDAVEMYVWEYYTRSALSTGTLPFWNPWHFAGTPYLADVQKNVLYPLAWLLRWVPLDDFFTWMAALHVWIAGAGTLFLARVVGLGWMASTATAIAGMLGGTTGAGLNNGQLLPLYVVAWFSWALGFAIVSVRRATVMPHPALVVVLVLQFLAGFIQSSLYLVTSVCLYYAFSIVWRESDRSIQLRLLVHVMILGALGLGLAAFQLVPTARLVAHATRASGIPYEMAIEGGWAAHNLVSFFFPFLGIASHPPYRELSEGIAYVGWVLMAMVPLAFYGHTRRLAVFFGLLTGVALATVITDLPFYRLHHALFPGFREPGRILFVATLSLTVLGGLGLERFVELATVRRWRVLTAWLAPSAAALVVAGLVVRSASGTGRLLPGVPAWPWLPAFAVIGLVLVALAAAHRRTAMALAIALVLVTSEMLALTAGAAVPVEIQATNDVRHVIGTPSLGRAISTCENRIDAGEMLRNRQASLDGFAGGIVLRDYADWVAIALSGSPPRQGDFLHGIDSEGGVLPLRRDLIDAANVSVIVSCGPLSAPSLTLVSTVEGVSVYRSESVRPRAFWTCAGSMTTKSEAASRIVQSRYDEAGRLQPHYYIHVRWMPQLAADARLSIERRYGLAEGEVLDAHTWRYTLTDPSAVNILALIGEAAVEDTHGVDRVTGLLTQPPVVIDKLAGGDEAQLLTGTEPCTDHGSVDVKVRDQPDGHLVATVRAPASGYVFLSESFYPEREAFIDGQPVTAFKANMAFTAVPVPAGSHTLELRYVPHSFRLGMAISALTLIVWTASTVRKKRPRPEAQPFRSIPPNHLRQGSGGQVRRGRHVDVSYLATAAAFSTASHGRPRRPKCP